MTRLSKGHFCINQLHLRSLLFCSSRLPSSLRASTSFFKTLTSFFFKLPVYCPYWLQHPQFLHSLWKKNNQWGRVAAQTATHCRTLKAVRQESEGGKIRLLTDTLLPFYSWTLLVLFVWKAPSLEQQRRSGDASLQLWAKSVTQLGVKSGVSATNF